MQKHVKSVDRTYYQAVVHIPECAGAKIKVFMIVDGMVYSEQAISSSPFLIKSESRVVGITDDNHNFISGSLLFYDLKIKDTPQQYSIKSSQDYMRPRPFAPAMKAKEFAELLKIPEEQWRENQGKELALMYYKDFLQTPYWKTIASIVKKRDKKRCTACCEKFPSQELHAHHTTYENRGSELFHLDDIQSLCQTCHYDQHVKLSAEKEIKQENV